MADRIKITISGPQGIGKTSLATIIAYALMGKGISIDGFGVSEMNLSDAVSFLHGRKPFIDIVEVQE